MGANFKETNSGPKPCCPTRMFSMYEIVLKDISKGQGLQWNAICFSHRCCNPFLSLLWQSKPAIALKHNLGNDEILLRDIVFCLFGKKVSKICLLFPENLASSSTYFKVRKYILMKSYLVSTDFENTSVLPLTVY